VRNNIESDGETLANEATGENEQMPRLSIVRRTF